MYLVNSNGYDVNVAIVGYRGEIRYAYLGANSYQGLEVGWLLSAPIPGITVVDTPPSTHELGLTSASYASYGGFYKDNLNLVLADMVAGDWYLVSSTDCVPTALRGMTHTDGLLTIGIKGLYQVTYALSLSCNTDSETLVTAVLVGNTNISSGILTTTASLGKIGTVSGNALIALEVEDVVKAGVGILSTSVPTVTVVDVSVIVRSIA